MDCCLYLRGSQLSFLPRPETRQVAAGAIGCTWSIKHGQQYSSLGIEASVEGQDQADRVSGLAWRYLGAVSGSSGCLLSTAMVWMIWGCRIPLKARSPRNISTISTPKAYTSACCSTSSCQCGSGMLGSQPLQLLDALCSQHNFSGWLWPGLCPLVPIPAWLGTGVCVTDSSGCEQVEEGHLSDVYLAVGPPQIFS